jgi:hypothetical protein
LSRSFLNVAIPLQIGGTRLGSLGYSEWFYCSCWLLWTTSSSWLLKSNRFRVDLFRSQIHTQIIVHNLTLWLIHDSRPLNWLILSRSVCWLSHRRVGCSYISKILLLRSVARYSRNHSGRLSPWILIRRRNPIWRNSDYLRSRRLDSWLLTETVGLSIKCDSSRARLSASSWRSRANILNSRILRKRHWSKWLIRPRLNQLCPWSSSLSR